MALIKPYTAPELDRSEKGSWMFNEKDKEP